MTVIAVALFLVGALAGFIIGRAADCSYTTFNHGTSWFKSGDVRKPVTRAELVSALQQVRRECDVPCQGEMTIEVRL